MEYASIEYDHLWDMKKQEMVFTHKWVGTSKLAKMHPPYHELAGNEAMLQGDKLTVGNFRLRIVGDEGMYWIVAFDSWYAPVYKVFHRAIKSLDMLKYCLIIILSIWGLATYEPGRIPSWRDIKGLGKQSPGGIGKA